MTTQKNFKVKKKRIWYKCKVWREYNTGTTLTWIWNFFIDKENNNPEIALKCHVKFCPGINKRALFKEFPLRAPGLLYKLGLFPCDGQWLASSWRRSPISVSLLPCLEIGTLGFFLLDVSKLQACYSCDKEGVLFTLGRTRDRQPRWMCIYFDKSSVL